MTEVRRLEPTDALIYQNLRLEALERHPEAFGASLEDERLKTAEAVGDRLAQSNVFGAFESDDLAGVAGWYRLSGDKMSHRGGLWGMYVRPSARSRGLGRVLIEAVLSDARGTVEQMHLTVVAGNDAARHLYEKTGFVVYGVEPHALKLADRYVDEILMVRRPI